MFSHFFSFLYFEFKQDAIDLFSLYIHLVLSLLLKKVLRVIVVYLEFHRVISDPFEAGSFPILIFIPGVCY